MRPSWEEAVERIGPALSGGSSFASSNIAAPALRPLDLDVAMQLRFRVAALVK
jgi:hypothetical protein